MPADDLSLPSCAAFLIFWAAPTDRALTGWSPWDETVSDMGERDLAGWLRCQLMSCPDERGSRVTAASAPNVMVPVPESDTE